MTIEYAGTLFDTRHAAQMACIRDYMTVCGTECPRDVLDDLRPVDVEARELMRSEWSIPYADDWTQEDYEDLISAWVEVVS